MIKKIIFLCGLPRSGSTLLANILGMHPQIAATPTSPLAHLVETLRQAWSQDESLLAQLDSNGDHVYERLRRASRAFIEAWSSDDKKPIVIDKSRTWLFNIEILRALYPDFKMIISLRDLRDIYCSLEKHHRDTVLLTLPGAPEANMVDVRAARLFAPTGLVGGPLFALYNLGDLPDLSENLFFWHYERFLEAPQAMTERLLAWVGASPATLDLGEIRQSTHEADSYYRLKYPHKIASHIRAPRSFREREGSRRILEALVQRFAWYYRQFYGRDGVAIDREDSSQVLQWGRAG